MKNVLAGGISISKSFPGTAFEEPNMLQTLIAGIAKSAYLTGLSRKRISERQNMLNYQGLAEY